MLAEKVAGDSRCGARCYNVETFQLSSNIFILYKRSRSSAMIMSHSKVLISPDYSCSGTAITLSCVGNNGCAMESVAVGSYSAAQDNPVETYEPAPAKLSE